jgi:hypothetical protein
MTNVLDLKHPQPVPPSDPEPAAAPVPEPVIPQEIPEQSQGPVPFLFSALAGMEPVAWEARHTLSERGRYRHYVAMAGFVLAGGAIAWWQSSWLTLGVVLAGLVAWELHERFAQPVSVVVSEEGVTVNGYTYPHDELSSFDLQQMADGTVHLSLALRKWHSPHLLIPLGEQDPERVRDMLTPFVGQESHGVAPLERFIRWG